MSGWLRGVVKEVPSGDTVVVVAGAKPGQVPPEKRITLASLVAPKLGRRDGTSKDEPFAWQAREFLRRKLVGKTVVFKVDYVVEQLGNREFGSVVVEGAAGAPQENAALAVVAAGFAKVRAPGGGQGQQQQASPFLEELRRAEEAAQAAGLGMWSKDPSALAGAVRAAAPALDGAALLAKAGGKGKPVQAVVEAVLNGGLLRVTMLPDLTPASVAVCGVVCPSLNRRPAPGAAAAAPASAAPAAEDGATAEAAAPGSLASKLAATSVSGAGAGPAAAGVTEPFAREARWFTEQRALNREVKLVLEGVDKHGNLFASVFPPAAPAAPAAAAAPAAPAAPSSSIAEGLVAAGLARTAEWSLAMMTTGAQRLREAERAAKAAKRGVWHNYVPQNTGQTKLNGSFTGKVIEVVSGDTLVIADASAGGAERRVQLSSIRAPRPGVRDRAPEPYGNDAREFLRRKLVGREVKVQMEYTRKIGGGAAAAAAAAAGGADAAAAAAAGADERVLSFGNVELAGGGSVVAPAAAASNGHSNGSAAANGSNGAAAPSIQQEELRNAAELIVARGLATVIRHRADEERSSVYERLMQLEELAKKGKRGLHSAKEPPAAPRLNDVSGAGGAARAKQYLPFLQRAGRVPAVVEYVLSGHRLKVFIPKEGVSIAFAPSGVRAPTRAQPAQGGRPATQGEPYADEALAWTRAHFMQRDVEIEVEGMDKGGTFLGAVHLVGRGGGGGGGGGAGGGSHHQNPANQLSLGPALLRAGLAKLTPFFSTDRVRGGEMLLEAQQQAKEARRKVWEHWSPEAEAAAAAAAAAANGAADDDEDAAAADSATAANGKGGASSAAPAKAVVVTEMAADGSGDFFVQQADEPRVAWVAEQLKAVGAAAPPSGAPLPSFTKGQLIAAQFSLDGNWYRAYIESVSPSEPRYEVFFVDYGNRERVPSSKARALEPAVAAVPPLAQPAALAHIRLPPADSEYAPDACDLLASLLGGGRRLEAVVAARVRPEAPDRHPARSQPKVMLVLKEVVAEDKKGGDKAGSSADAEKSSGKSAADDDGAPPSLNAEMLLAGLARLPGMRRIRDPREKEALMALQRWQDEAKRAHRGIFELGDVDDSDDEAEAARAARFGGGGRR